MIVHDEGTSVTPHISVIITTYDEEIYDDFKASVRNVIKQEYDDFEVVIVTETDHAESAVARDFGDEDAVTHIHSDRSLNLASARNLGAEHAIGDIYAFIDDDAVAREGWLEHIASAYTEHDPPAVGGKLVADWPTDEPRFLPPEFYWLVGVTHRGFREKPGYVRNTFGANITFRAEIFDELGGFDTGFGKDHGHNLQGEETELCARIRKKTGTGLYYVPDAVVAHRVYDWQLQWRWLFDRAYWQGYSKRLLKQSVSDSVQTEQSFLRSLALESTPRYVKETVLDRSFTPLGRCLIAYLLTVTVVFGYVACTLSAFTER